MTPLNIFANLLQYVYLKPNTDSDILTWLVNVMTWCLSMTHSYQIFKELF